MGSQHVFGVLNAGKAFFLARLYLSIEPKLGQGFNALPCIACPANRNQICGIAVYRGSTRALGCWIDVIELEGLLSEQSKAIKTETSLLVSKFHRRLKSKQCVGCDGERRAPLHQFVNYHVMNHGEPSDQGSMSRFDKRHRTPGLKRTCVPSCPSQNELVQVEFDAALLARLQEANSLEEGNEIQEPCLQQRSRHTRTRVAQSRYGRHSVPFAGVAFHATDKQVLLVTVESLCQDPEILFEAHHRHKVLCILLRVTQQVVTRVLLDRNDVVDLHRTAISLPTAPGA